MVDEEAACFDTSSLAILLDSTCIAYLDHDATTAANNTANTTPTQSGQISKLKALIAQTKDFRESTEQLEVKLRELEALPPPSGKSLICNQAKEKARQAKEL